MEWRSGAAKAEGEGGGEEARTFSNGARVVPTRSTLTDLTAKD
jgi:hypothetical protein